MNERARTRLRGLSRLWAVPPWLLVAWGMVSFAGNIQFLIGAYSWTVPRITGLSGPVQGGLMTLVGFAWLGYLVLHPEKRLAAADLRQLNAKRLRNYTVDLTQKLRQFEAEESQRERLLSDQERHVMASAPSDQEKQKLWDENASKLTARRQARDTAYRTRFHADTMAVYDALKERVGDIENEPRGIPVVLRVGMLAGPYPIQEAADYLDRLARLLG